MDAEAGEVLGIGGLMGAGRTELLLHLYGAWGKRTAGEVRLRDLPYPDSDPRESIARGLVLATEDRRRHGLVLGESVGFNLSLPSLRRFTRPVGRIDQAAEHAENQRMFDALRVKAPGLEARTAGLSGGNQQKVVLGKWLATNPRILIMDEPTRGIDVGAKAEIHQLMRKLAGEGMAILMISSELPEVLGMSDRVLVMNGGRIIGEFDKDHATAEAVGTVMTRSMAREDAA